MQGKKIITISTTLKGLNILKQVFSVKHNIVPPLLRFIPKPRAKLLRPVLILAKSRVKVVFPYWHPLSRFLQLKRSMLFREVQSTFSFCLGTFSLVLHPPAGGLITVYSSNPIQERSNSNNLRLKQPYVH